MKRKVVSILFAAVIVMSLFPVTAGAQRSISGTWNSGFQLANMDAAQAAAIGIKFYDTNGDAVIFPGGSDQVSDSIPAGESKTYYLPNIDGMPSGQFSAVVSSSTQIAAVTNVTNYNANMADSYPGFSEGASSVSLPLIMFTPTWFSKISVQATSAATFYIEFYAPGSTSPVMRYPSSGTVSLGAGAAQTFDTSAPAFSGLGSSFVGSAVVTATSGSVVALVQEFRTVTYSLVSILPGSTSSGTKLLAPLVYNDFQKNSFPVGLAWRTGIQVQNVGGASTYVRVTIYGTSPVGTWDATKQVAANASETFYLPTDFAQTNMYGSAVIESCSDSACSSAGNGENIVAIVNTTKYGSDVGMAYNAFVDGTASSQVSIPLVYGTFQQSIFGAGKEWRSGVQVMNVDSTDTYVKATFTNANASLSGGPWSVQSTSAVWPGESYTFYLPDLASLPTEFYGSAEIQAVDASGNPVSSDIIAIVNTTKYSGNFATCYPGINH